jgi:tight adherence protein B
MTSIRRAALGAVALLTTLALVSTATAQAALELRLREAILSEDGTTRLIVSVTGPAVQSELGDDAFTVTEAGEPISSFTVEPLSQSNAQAVAVALVMDVSGSTAGQPLADAKAAARTLINGLPASVRVALISFGPTAAVRVPFTTDKARLSGAINALQAGGGTALYDAVVLGANTLNAVSGAQHNLIVFSDGADDGSSRATIAQAIQAAQTAKAPVTSVGLITATFDQRALDQLAGAVEGGRSLSVAASGDLASAFGQVAQEIASQYVISYVSDRREPKDLDISVGVTAGGVQAQDVSTVINNRTGKKPVAPGPGQPQLHKSRALVGLFASKTGYYVGIGAVFLAVLLFLGMLLYTPGKGRAVEVLQRGLRLYSRAERKKEKQRQEGFFAGTAVGRRAVEFMEKVPKSEAFEQNIQTLLDRAAWPLRATEFIILQIGGAVAGALIGFGLLGRWWLGIVFLVIGAIAPRLVLAQRVGKRESEFLAQLPDVLQLLSGSLQAGYGFMQAIDTVAKEAQPPASTEFSRVLSEARLGMPIDEALNAMAERVGGEDFRWVVLAINIQRQVGGNLAQLLTTVANTLREREMVRRQIKVLSAEGRLSAMILVALPFVLAGYISVVNPGYINQLFEETIGKIMIVAGMVLMGIGILWMRKIIKIDV